MPELPEVETVARTLAPHVSSSQIISACLLRNTSLHPLSFPVSESIGCKIISVRRRAKLLILDLEPPNFAGPTLLVAHLRMTGSLCAMQTDSEPGKHTRCVFRLMGSQNDVKQLFFNDIRAFGQLLLGRKESLEKWDFWQTLGPEPLEMPDNALASRLSGKRPIKNALLDQKVIAGIGNIYADESLFAAGILPARPADSLSAPESRKLLKSIKKILKEAIAKRGSSIRDYRDADGKSGSFQKSFFVYGRSGEKCKKCGTPLSRTKLGGRSTVYCSVCQQ